MLWHLRASTWDKCDEHPWLRHCIPQTSLGRPYTLTIPLYYPPLPPATPHYIQEGRTKVLLDRLLFAAETP
jgi:hypothetical protein